MIKKYSTVLAFLIIILSIYASLYSCQKEIIQDEIDRESIINYIESNQLDGQFTPSGLWYQIIKPGGDELLELNSEINFDYSSYPLDGFRLSSKNDQTLNLGSTVPGWKEGLQMIGKGGVIKLIVPPNLAAGGDFPQESELNEVMVFDIFIHNNKIPIDNVQDEIDKTSIISYAKEHELMGQFTDNGLYYIIKERGTNNRPNSFSEVTTDYVLTLLNDNIIDTNENISFKLYDLISGCKEGLQLIGTGGKIKLIIPSNIGYGYRDLGVIPPNSILIFDFTVTSFKN